jgi:hypothetical protein
MRLMVCVSHSPEFMSEASQQAKKEYNKAMRLAASCDP